MMAFAVVSKVVGLLQPGERWKTTKKRSVITPAMMLTQIVDGLLREVVVMLILSPSQSNKRYAEPGEKNDSHLVLFVQSRGATTGLVLNTGKC